jgi:hypothetical protein
MTTALKIMLATLVCFAGAAFIGLLGFAPVGAFLTSEVAFFLYAAAGMAFIGLTDRGGRRAMLTHA